MAQFHFVEDYERHVADLIAKYPIDEAMSLAVGGDYETIGRIASDILIWAGLRDGMSVLDFGCGSGRVATAIAKRVSIGNFLGVDIVQSLLDYAASKTPPHFQYVNHRELSIPAESESFDVAYAFSVFTHLLQPECYLYLADISRTLKPGGTVVLSYLDMTDHWPIFEHTVDVLRQHQSAPLNMFLSGSQIRFLAGRCGLAMTALVPSNQSRWNAPPLGQAVAVLRKRNPTLTERATVALSRLRNRV